MRAFDVRVGRDDNDSTVGYNAILPVFGQVVTNLNAITNDNILVNDRSPNSSARADANARQQD